MPRVTLPAADNDVVTIKLAPVISLLLPPPVVNAGITTVPLTLRLLATILPTALRLPAKTLPVTDNVVNMPVEVMLGCALAVIVVADPTTLPTMLPATDTLVNKPTDVILG